jgi:ketol-acid reductoisomerase
MAYASKVEKRLPQVMIDTAKPFINVPMACDPYAERQWYIGEYSVSIQAEFKKLEEKGIDKETALAKVIANHPEMFPDAIKQTIETGEEIDADAFADIEEYIEDFDISAEEYEESEDEDEIPYAALFDE